MNHFAKRIRPYVNAELNLAVEAERHNDAHQAFAYLERAHVLGQAATREHVRVHWLMLRWGIKHRQPKEIVGQVVRLIGAATKTAVGLIPTGNTGGSNISPFKRLPVPTELANVIAAARENS